MSGGGIICGEDRSKFLTVDWLNLLCGEIWATGKAGSLGNNTGTAKVEEFGDRLVETTVYPKLFLYVVCEYGKRVQSSNG